ncbi:hypothetical protein [Conexibacter sp. CPCC 206217]|uniref:hypothetical protein n=1 Tax=Conexibacter sp. CPCC 206217 TaxID=3064574 RepID=UPI00271B9FD9|nr:hypothetical protein [Conexibacter sp. CPCC 206217]MDO8214163.1 hypothetical protein [Conexibacter sp. CPCC 206217]
MRLHRSASNHLAEAAVLGVTAGLRSMTPLAALALRGRVPGPPALKWVLLAAAAGELVGDKLPMTPARTSPPALGGRLASGAIAGALVAGPAGAAVGALAAGLGAYAGQYGRAALSGKTGWPDPVIAIGEDKLALGLAYVGTRGLD